MRRVTHAGDYRRILIGLAIPANRLPIQVMRPFAAAREQGAPPDRLADPDCHFALVGAGPTGVELAGQIREVAAKTLLAEYRHIKPEDAQVLLFDGWAGPLAPFSPKLSAKAAAALDKLGAGQRMRSIVTEIDGIGLAVHPHRLPDRLPQPVRRRDELVVRPHPRPVPGTHVHHQASGDRP